MKSILVIGLGSFGKFAALKYAELGNEVMAVDINESNVADVIDYVTGAQIGDCTDEDVLKSLGVNNYDICLVAIGTNFQSSLEITSLLKDYGAKFVISKATRDIQEKFLLRNGADRVVYPDKQLGRSLALHTTNDSLFDFFELTPEYAVYEMPPLESWVGRTISQLDVRKKYNITILATKSGDNIIPLPTAEYIFKKDEHLVVLGNKKSMNKFL